MFDDEDEKPELQCRMYESLYPAEGSIVMGKVTKIDGNKATVYLVEYRKNSNLLLSDVIPPVRVLTLKRMEAFRVLRVNVEAGEVLLEEEPLALEDIWKFETTFNEAKFVHSVFYSVADDLDMKLEEAYNLAAWPSLKEMKALHKNEKFLTCENVPFKKMLIERIALMRHTSWRIKDPSLLQSCSLKQLHDICYAIALTRHGEAFFKKHGILARDKYLSIQDVVNKAVAAGLIDRDWTLPDLERLVSIVKDEGFIRDKVCPLTYSREVKAAMSDSDSEDISTFPCCQDPHCPISTFPCCQDPHCPFALSPERKTSESGDSSDSGSSEADGPKPKLEVPQMIVFTAGTDLLRDDMSEFILGALKEGPLTCSVFMFPSYKSVRKDVIFEPTPDEKVAFEIDNGVGLDLHTMLLTGDGVDRRGKHYLEFQDSLGDIENGDRGFIRFAVEPSTVSDCVIFKNFYDHDKDFD